MNCMKTGKTENGQLKTLMCTECESANEANDRMPWLQEICKRMQDEATRPGDNNLDYWPQILCTAAPTRENKLQRQ